MRPLSRDGIAAVLISLMILFAATSSSAAFDSWSEFSWEGSAAERVTAQGIDAVIVRPISLVRAAIGMVFVLPAALFAAPGGQESIDEALEVFIVDPVNYVFRRKLGEF